MPRGESGDPRVSWMRVTFLGWVLGILLTLLVIMMSGAIGLGHTQFPVGLGMGAGVGLMQRRFIDAHDGTGIRWWRATALGLVAPFLLWDVAQLLPADLPNLLVPCIVAGGLVTGALQWRATHEGLAGGLPWIVASLLGWSLAGSTILLSDRALPKIPGVIGALLYLGVIALGGLALGAVTAPGVRRVLASAQAKTTSR